MSIVQIFLAKTLIILSILLTFVLFPTKTFACDTSKPYKTVLTNTCKIACNNSNNGVWAGYVAYADSELDFLNNKYCAQEEYFQSEQACKTKRLDLRTSNPCPAGCTDHSQCGSSGTCADGNLGAGEICKGNYGTSNKWCVQTLCGWECDPNPDYCRVKTAATAREGTRTGCYWADNPNDKTCQGSGLQLKNTGIGINNDDCRKCVPPATTTTPIICSDLSRENLTYSCRPPTSSGSCPTGYTDSKYSPTDCDQSGQKCCLYSGGPRSCSNWYGCSSCDNKLGYEYRDCSDGAFEKRTCRDATPCSTSAPPPTQPIPPTGCYVTLSNQTCNSATATVRLGGSGQEGYVEGRNRTNWLVNNSLVDTSSATSVTISNLSNGQIVSAQQYQEVAPGSTATYSTINCSGQTYTPPSSCTTTGGTTTPPPGQLVCDLCAGSDGRGYWVNGGPGGSCECNCPDGVTPNDPDAYTKNYHETGVCWTPRTNVDPPQDGKVVGRIFLKETSTPPPGEIYASGNYGNLRLVNTESEIAQFYPLQMYYFNNNRCYVGSLTPLPNSTAQICSFIKPLTTANIGFNNGWNFDNGKWAFIFQGDKATRNSVDPGTWFSGSGGTRTLYLHYWPEGWRPIGYYYWQEKDRDQTGETCGRCEPHSNFHAYPDQAGCQSSDCGCGVGSYCDDACEADYTPEYCSRPYSGSWGGADGNTTTRGKFVPLSNLARNRTTAIYDLPCQPDRDPYGPGAVVDLVFEKELPTISGNVCLSDSLDPNACRNSCRQNIAGATVKITSLDSTYSNTVTTDTSGNYIFPNLEKQRYEITLEKPANSGGITSLNPYIVNLQANRAIDFCTQPLKPWLQTKDGDVHSNTIISNPGGP